MLIVTDLVPLTFPLLYMIEKYTCCHYIRHIGVARSMRRPIHRVGPAKRAFWAVYISRCSLWFGSPSL